MDNSTSLVPGRNPTGGPIYGDEGFVPGMGTTSGQNPMLPPLNLPGGAPASNPYTGSVVPVFGANSGPYSPSSLFTGPTPGATNVSTAAASPIGGMNLMSPKDLSRMFNDLKKTYGDGAAHAILDFLTSGAGFNQAAINNLLAAMQPGIERGTESLMNQFSTMGNRFGSGAQIGLADYLSQVQLNEGEIETQMYEDAIKNYMDVLMGTSSTTAKRKSAGGGGFLGGLTSLLGGLGGGSGISDLFSMLPGLGGAAGGAAAAGGLDLGTATAEDLAASLVVL